LLVQSRLERFQVPNQNTTLVQSKPWKRSSLRNATYLSFSGSCSMKTFSASKVLTKYNFLVQARLSASKVMKLILLGSRLERFKF